MMEEKGEVENQNSKKLKGFEKIEHAESCECKATSLHVCFSSGKVGQSRQRSTRDGNEAEHSLDSQQDQPEPAAVLPVKPPPEQPEQLSRRAPPVPLSAIPRPAGQKLRGRRDLGHVELAHFLRPDKYRHA